MKRHVVRNCALAASLLAVASCSHDSTAPKPTVAFQIIVQNVGPALKPSVQTAFDSAVAIWGRVITASLPPVANFSTTANECGTGFPAFPAQTITNIVIQVRFDSIDGPGKVLGRSGPCFLRNSPDNRPVFGTMTFDTADATNLQNSGQLNAVILHEMGHVLGFGTLWLPSYFNCVQLPATDTTTPDTYYNCPHALAQFDSIGGTSYTGGNKVPLENCKGIAGCGSGTYNSHWRESVFFNELMTGYLNNGTPNPLSSLTAAAMADLGYTVDKTAAQSYARVFTSTMPLVLAPSGPSLDLSGDAIGPIGTVAPDGRRMYLSGAAAGVLRR